MRVLELQHEMIAHAHLEWGTLPEHGLVGRLPRGEGLQNLPRIVSRRLSFTADVNHDVSQLLVVDGRVGGSDARHLTRTKTTHQKQKNCHR